MKTSATTATGRPAANSGWRRHRARIVGLAIVGFAMIVAMPEQQRVIALADDSAKGMQPYAIELAGATPFRMEMVPIDVGTPGRPKRFLLGSPDAEAGRKKDEGPQREIEVESFWMGKCEVTWDQFDHFRAEYARLGSQRLDPTATAKTPEWADAVSIPTPLWEQDSAPILEGLGTRGGYPVADISQFAARQFTKWLSKKTGNFYRLATEAEWEYAARAGTTTAYFFGDDSAKLGDYAWTFDNSAYDDEDKGYPGAGAGYRKVGLKKANPFGLHDIYGNVSEWVVDQYQADAYQRLGGKATPWRDAIVWPKQIFPCVTRGGNWESDPEACRSAARLPSNKKWQYRDPQIPKSIWWYTDAFHVGFRVVRPKVEPPRAEQLAFWDGEITDIHEILADGSKELRAPIVKQDASTTGAKPKER